MEPVRLYFEVLRLVLLCLLAAAAAYFDLKHSRIPNPLALGAVAAGIVLGLAAGGWSGGADALWGLLAGAGPLLVIYLIGLSGSKPLMGAGDVKLMAGVGALTGPWGALWSIYYGLWIAGAAALVLVATALARRQPIPKVLPFGACLAVGAALALMMHPQIFIQMPR